MRNLVYTCMRKQSTVFVGKGQAIAPNGLLAATLVYMNENQQMPGVVFCLAYKFKIGYTDFILILVSTSSYFLDKGGRACLKQFAQQLLS